MKPANHTDHDEATPKGLKRFQFSIILNVSKMVHIKNITILLICQEKTASETGDFEFLAILFINSLYSAEYPFIFRLSADLAMRNSSAGSGNNRP